MMEFTTSRDAVLAALDDSPHGRILATRFRVKPTDPCAGCGEPLEDEFITYGVDGEPEYGTFDGVVTSALRPFHHGCEDE